MTELGNEARRLLDLVRTSDGPGHDDQRRVAQGVAASVGVLASSLAEAGSAAAFSAAAPMAARVATAGLVFKALGSSILGLGLGFAVAVPAALVASNPPGTTPAPRVLTVPAPTLEPAKPRSEPAPVAAAAPTARSRARAPVVAAGDNLAREVELLAAVQAELRTGQGQRALELLNAYEREAKGSTLGPERAAARVLASCAIGDVATARRVAGQFLAASPDSPVVPRIRRSCAFSTPRQK
jgi:hypothetical protein